jgi:hypothetical protein
MSFLANKFPFSGNANGVASGSRVSANAVKMGRVKFGTLAAVATVDAETDTLTMAGVWQGANVADFSDAVDLAHDPQNPAATVFDTGTGGADAANTKAFPCPLAGYAFKFVRFQVQIGGTAGAAADTIAVGYNYRSF